MAMYLGSNEVAVTKISQDSPYDYLGTNAKYLGKAYEWNGKLSDTTYSSWDPSTTSMTILNAADGLATFNIPDGNSKCYFVLERFFTEVAFISGATLANTTAHFMYSGFQIHYRYPSTAQIAFTDWNNWTSATNTSLAGKYHTQYYNTQGVLTAIGGVL